MTIDHFNVHAVRAISEFRPSNFDLDFPSFSFHSFLKQNLTHAKRLESTEKSKKHMLGAARKLCAFIRSHREYNGTANAVLLRWLDDGELHDQIYSNQIKFVFNNNITSIRFFVYPSFQWIFSVRESICCRSGHAITIKPKSSFFNHYSNSNRHAAFAVATVWPVAWWCKCHSSQWVRSSYAWWEDRRMCRVNA